VVASHTVKKTAVLTKPEPGAQALYRHSAARLFGFFLLCYFHLVFLESTVMRYFPSHRYSGPQGVFDLPLGSGRILWLFLLGFWFLLPRFSLRASSRREMVHGLALYLLATFFVIGITHIPLPFRHFIVPNHPRIANTAFVVFAWAPAAYVAQLLPALGLFWFFFGTTFLAKHKRAIAGCLVMAAVFAAVRSAERLWEKWVTGPAIFLTRVVLAPFTGWNSRSVFDQHLSLGTFAVNVKAACSGLQWVFFFAAAYICIWIILAQSRPVSRTRGMIGLIGGIMLLYIFNGLRIASLLAVGYWSSSQVSVDIFHSFLGAVISFFVFLAYVKWVFPWMTRPVHG
jgi:exosortase/archaeosortase family protein